MAEVRMIKLAAQELSELIVIGDKVMAMADTPTNKQSVN